MLELLTLLPLSVGYFVILKNIKEKIKEIIRYGI